MAEIRGRNVDLKADLGNLYREDVITDLKVATIRRLTPVKADGSPDEKRPILFMGQTQVLTQAGPIPVDAPIQASNLQEALERFPEAVSQAIEHMFAQLDELRRREASRIVVPGAGAGKILVP